MTCNLPTVRRAAVALMGAVALASCDGQPASVDATGAAGSANQSGGVAATPPTPVAPTMAPNHLSQQQPIIRDEPRIEKPRQIGIYTPPRGSAERVALMNALRGQVRGELGGDVIFVVSALHSNGEWAFGQLEPTWPDGRAIRMEGTPAYRDNPHLDGLRTEAIWRKERGRWTTYAFAIGSSDVWWLAHCDKVPAGIMRGCS
jgi:hypothetical protein